MKTFVLGIKFVLTFIIFLLSFGWIFLVLMFVAWLAELVSNFFRELSIKVEDAQEWFGRIGIVNKALDWAERHKYRYVDARDPEWRIKEQRRKEKIFASMR